MNLKGNYSDETTYEVGDVVLFTDGVSYFLRHPCKAGTPPVDTMFWSRTSQYLNEVVKLCMDAVEMANSDDVVLEDDLNQTTAGKKALDAHQGKVLKGLIPENIDDKGIVLNSSTEGSTKQFLLTIYDPSGEEDPELTITEVPSETAEESET
jgi:hypothetical protein